MAIDYDNLDSGCLADDTCGSVTFYGGSGEAFTINLGHDPEYTLSGLYEPDMSFDGY